MAFRTIPEEARGLVAAIAEAMGGDEVPLCDWHSLRFPHLVRACVSEDLAATVVRKAFEFMAEGGVIVNELAWMARVARNAAVDDARLRRRVPKGAIDHRLAPEPEDDERGDFDAMREVLLHLRPPYREAMLLRYIEEWPRRRVIGFLMEKRGIGVSGARQILRRGRAMVHRGLHRQLARPPGRPAARRARGRVIHIPRRVLRFPVASPRGSPVMGVGA